jgi:tape measure domain-containing protein
MARNLEVGLEIDFDDNGAIRGVRQITDGLHGIEGAGGRASRGAQLFGAALGALSLAAVGRELLQFGTSIITTGAKFETLAIQMRTVTGSSEAAERAMSWITDFTANTPYQLEQVSQSFVKLKAFGLDPMDGTMQAIADHTSAMGGEIDVMNGVVLALGKAFAKGKLQGEEWDMMLERGIPVTRILSEKLGVTNDELLKMRTRGELGREAIQMLIEGMGELTSGASANLMDSFTGLWSNLQDQITLTLKDLAEGGLLDTAKDGLKAFVDVLGELRDSGFISDFGAALSQTLSDAIPLLEGAAKGIKNFAVGFTALRQMAATVSLDLATRSVEELTKRFEYQLEMFRKGGEDAAFWQQKMRATAVELQRAQQAQEKANKTWDETDGILERLINGEENLTKHTKALLKPTEELADTTEDTTEALKKSLDVLTGNNVAGGLGLVEAMEEGANQFSLFGGESDTLANAINNALNPSLEAGRKKLEELDAGAEKARKPVRDLADTVEQASLDMEKTFSDLLMVGFGGQLESFADLWDEIWGSLAKSMVGILGDALEDAFAQGGTVGGVLVRFWDNMKQSIEKNALGAGIAGAGGIYQGYQQGGLGGFLSGAMGGMQLGGALGAIGGPAGIGLGMGIGAAAGGILSLFGGEDQPQVWGTVGLEGGAVGQSDTDLTGRARALWVNERVQEYRAAIMSMNDILRLFEDENLFDMIREAPEFEFTEADINQVTAIFREQFIPHSMREMFRKAINQGLKGLGLDQDTRRQLWQELQPLGADQIPALESFINSLVNITNLYDDMNWNAIQDAARQDSMQAFLGGMGDALEAVQMQMLGLDSMTLLERADQATKIEQLIVSARQAEIQYLQQLDSLQKSLNQSIDAQIESIRVGGMTDTQAANFYADQINAIMEQMRAGITSPEMAQQLVADLQRYIGAYQGVLGDDIYSMSVGGQSLADHLIGALEEARGLSNEAFETMRDQIRESNDALIAELQRLIEALTHFGTAMDTAEPASETLDVSGQFDIHVHPSELFETWVDARIEQHWYQKEYTGPN